MALPYKLINHQSFYCPNKDTYPPFKKGLYMEEYFMRHMINNNITHNKSGRRYLPILWTNFQIESWFQSNKSNMQKILDEYIKENPCEAGYFTIVQYDDGPLLKLPENTVVYGACSGDISLPLIYEDIDKKLQLIEENCKKERNLLCSFVGTKTHPVRNRVIDKYNSNSNFLMSITGGWTPIVDIGKQNIFINLTLKSKFSLAPRGYGRSSFRFFEIITLGAIPIYVWDDKEWLPYLEEIDYKKFCISINVNEIDKLEEILLSITPEKYNEMKKELENHKKYMTLDYMCEYLVNH
jgi:hypothetical protein